MTARLALAALAVMAVGCSQAAGREPATELPPRGALLWSADHETGRLREWTAGQGAAGFHTGDAGARVEVVPFARSGSHALALRIDTSNGLAAARVFRWRENPQRGYYGAWYYFPQAVRPAAWWNVMQVKSLTADGDSLPTWVVNVTHDGDGMRLYLWDALAGRTYGTEQARVRLTLPTETWVHLEFYVERGSDGDGRVALLQDGVVLYDLVGRTTAVGPELHWSVNNYSDALTPRAVTVYVDDATIWAAEEVDGDD